MLDDQGFGYRQVQESLLFYKTPWPAYIQFDGHRVLFRKEQSGRGMRLTTHLHLTPSLKWVEFHLHSLYMSSLCVGKILLSLRQNVRLY